MGSRYSIRRLFDIIVTIVLIGVILAMIAYHFKKDSSVTENRIETVGRLIKYERLRNFNYSLTYEYMVSDTRYTGSVATEYFECANGSKGCVGMKVIVYYSSKDPQYSQVNLGKYDKYRTTIYLKE